MQKFVEFNFKIPSERTDLIDIANFLSKSLKNQSNEIENFDEFKDKILNDIFNNPKNRAVFERLKDK